MAGVDFQIKFFYQDILFVDTQAYLPRDQASKIPGLKLEPKQPKKRILKPESKSDPKKSEYDEDEMIDENQNQNDIDENEGDIDGQGQPEEMEIQLADQNQQDDEIQVNQSDNIQYDDEDEDDDIIDNDISSISRSISNIGNFGKYKTKRQKGQLDNFMELPSKRPRKDNKRLDEATELIRKEEKERKRKQYIKKLMEAQEKATFDKILNQTGRKFKQRQQKQLKEQLQKQKKIYRTLGDVPKVITCYSINEEGAQPKIEQSIYLHKAQLFDSKTLHRPEIKMGQICSVCQKNKGRYKHKKGAYFCSVSCYKILVDQK